MEATQAQINLLALYPFVIAGALSAFILCLITTIRTRKQRPMYWWLFVGVCFNMAALTAENIYFGYSRLLPMDGFVQLNVETVTISTFKIVHAIGAWFHFWSAMAVMLRQGEKLIIKGITFGTLFAAVCVLAVQIIV